MESVSLVELADEQLEAARPRTAAGRRTPCTAATTTCFGRR